MINLGRIATGTKTSMVFGWMAVFLMFSTALSSQILYEDLSLEVIKEAIENAGLELEDVEKELLLSGIDIYEIEKTGRMTVEQKNTIQNVIIRMTEDIQKESEENQDKDRKPKVSDSEEDIDEEEPEEEPIEDTLQNQVIIEEEPEILIYGQELFRNKMLSVTKKSDEINAPDSYILGPGDKLVVSIWGRTFSDEEHVIAQDGYIRLLSGRQRTYLKGLSLGEAREKLKRILRNSYKFSEGQFDLKLNFSRTVKVSIWGEVMEKPGAMAISAFNSAFDALSSVGGTNDIGSLRNIELRKSDGQKLIMDVYELLKDPSIRKNYFLDDNDIILVPVAENIVTLDGAVRRPLKYELRKGEGIRELLEYAGGLSEDAFRKKIQVTRYINDDQEILDVNWNDYQRRNQNFELYNGDIVYVEAIERSYRNYVEVVGEVSKQGQFQRIANMKISDVLKKAGLTQNSRTDILFITRTNDDGTTSLEKIDFDLILSDENHPQNLILNDRDKIEVWAKERFVDNAEISVFGSVRYEGKFPYDQNKSVTVRDAILLAGGLSRDAANIAIIHSNDPLNPKITEYKTIDNLSEVLADENAENNVLLNPFDSLVIESNNTFVEGSVVRIEGAVNRPGAYQYGVNMTLKDLLALSGGFKLSASTNNIEISRVVISNNEPTKTIVENIEMDRDFNVVSGSNKEQDYYLQPFDNIAVRYIKDFELQKRVFLVGEVQTPGPYAIYKENLKILEVIDRAGGLTDEAFPSGATLYRNTDSLGAIVIKLDEIRTNPNSEFNFVVKNGDQITIPKISEFVTIRGATRVWEVVSEENITEGNLIRVPYHHNKDAMFYINEFAGGLDDNADKSKILVTHANSEIKRPKNGFFKKKYPKVKRGSTITVGYKSEEDTEREKETDVNWTELLGDAVSQAMSILTLILLIQRLD